MLPCKFRLEDCAGSRRDFILGCSHALAASTVCRVTDRWFPPHFSVFACFGVDGWSVEVSCSVISQPLWPACWIDTPDRSSSSVSRTVQDAWDVYRDEFGVVPPGVVLALRDAAFRSSVDDFWSCLRVGAPRLFYLALILRLVVPLWLAALLLLEEVCYVFVGDVLEAELLVAEDLVGCKGLIGVMMLMVKSAKYFVNSSLVSVLLFRRRLKSVADVLKGIRSNGFIQSWREALVRYWNAVCCDGPCGPFCPFTPWDEWVHPDLHGFCKWVFDSLEVLNDFTKQVVVSRRDTGVRKWTIWLREDLGSRALCLVSGRTSFLHLPSLSSRTL